VVLTCGVDDKKSSRSNNKYKYKVQDATIVMAEYYSIVPIINDGFDTLERGGMQNNKGEMGGGGGGISRR
jgi:hypothetical protein